MRSVWPIIAPEAAAVRGNEVWSLPRRDASQKQYVFIRSLVTRTCLKTNSPYVLLTHSISLKYRGSSMLITKKIRLICPNFLKVKDFLSKNVEYPFCSPISDLFFHVETMTRRHRRHNTNCDYISRQYCWQKKMRLKCSLKNKNFYQNLSLFLVTKKRGQNIIDRSSCQDYTGSTQWAQSGGLLHQTFYRKQVKVNNDNNSAKMTKKNILVLVWLDWLKCSI